MDASAMDEFEDAEAKGFDSMNCGERVSAMWMRLAEQISSAIPDLVIDGKPEEAIRWATCAEAAFWKATGEADTHDVKDVLARDGKGCDATQREYDPKLTFTKPAPKRGRPGFGNAGHATR